jgi:hypothetical protein
VVDFDSIAGSWLLQEAIFPTPVAEFRKNEAWNNFYSCFFDLEIVTRFTCYSEVGSLANHHVTKANVRF